MDIEQSPNKYNTIIILDHSNLHLKPQDSFSWHKIQIPFLSSQNSEQPPSFLL